ncbi:hypothetical protein KVG96_10790 [Pseudomonas sp. COR58]|uniref:Uncharacterized protein n=1 Tax=Pseudomonas ekonensis TaxID=2842353 RepID=A0ABS6PDA2_9PSED|nr:hypothetical protein [Pseudomonas ekonensis]MBV4458438.1 hypothetical protein [Pseudomonas ekonensis]
MNRLNIIALGLAAAVSSLCANAYESDLHYGLTYWLAAQAGFDPLQTQEIARQNELTDTGMLDAKHAIIWDLCIWRDTNASGQTRALHFRSQNAPPLPPAQRKVTEDSRYAQGQSDSIIHTKPHEDPELQGKFGQALHGRQDAYSHAGQSNTFSPLCPELWIWSHPIDKGGIFSHVADQTFRAKEKCFRAASSTYGLMLRFRDTMSLATPPKKLDELETSIKEFCAASTKAEKSKWFVDQHVPQADAIAKNTSLEDGGRSFYRAPRIDLRRGVQSLAAVKENIPEYEQQEPGWLPAIEIDPKLRDLMMNGISASPKAREYARTLLRTWLTVPPEQLGGVVKVREATDSPPKTPAAVALLQRLRLKDQGRFAPKAFNLQSTKPEDYITLDGNDWASVLIPVRGQKAEALVGDLQDGFLVIAILRHAPNEVLLIKVTKDYELDEVTSLIFH